MDRVRLQAPGVFRYSNVGYLLVRGALTAHHDAPLFSILDHLVFRPLAIEAFPFAVLEDWDRCTLPVAPDLRTYDPGWVYPGTIAARASQMSAGLSRLMAGDLGAQVADQMRRAQPVEAPEYALPDLGYGLGLMTSGRPPTVSATAVADPGSLSMLRRRPTAAVALPRWSPPRSTTGRSSRQPTRSSGRDSQTAPRASSASTNWRPSQHQGRDASPSSFTTRISKSRSLMARLATREQRARQEAPGSSSDVEGQMTSAVV